MYIIHINDIHGFIKPEGNAIGYPKIGGFIESFKKEHPDTLVLDAGDAFNGSSYASFDKGAGVLKILNTLGLDAMAAGNADFALGRERLEELAGLASFPVLAANIVDANGKSVLQGSAKVTLAGGIRVGIIGLTTPRVGASGGMTNLDAVPAAQALVDELRPQVDVLVGLFHLGDTAMDMDNALLVTREVKGFDVIIDGHSHTFLPDGRLENGILIAQTGEYSCNVGLVELEMQEGRVTSAKARLLDKEALKNTPDKAETRKALEEVCSICDPYFSEVLGGTLTRLNGVRNDLRLGEASMGNLFADALRWKTGAEVGLVIAGVVGGDFAPGPLTRQDVLNMIRADGVVCRQMNTGEEILAALNAGVSSYPTPAGTFLQVSGISFTFDPSRKDDRVCELLAGGKPVNPKKLYSVGMLSFLRKFPGLDQGRQPESFGSCIELLEEYIQKNSPLNVAVEGRINRI